MKFCLIRILGDNKIYFMFSTYCSIAMVIDGLFEVGALIWTTRPASSAALIVEFPYADILVLFCLKSGKFLNNYSIPDGLKNTRIS